MRDYGCGDENGGAKTDAAQQESDRRLLGSMGRMDARWHGLVHLCAGFGAVFA